MKKLLFYIVSMVCVTSLSLFFASTTYATATVTIKLTSNETEVFNESLQEKVITISKGTPVIVLDEVDSWTKIQYKKTIGYLKSDHLKSISPQQMLVKAKNEPFVRVTNTQQSETIGKLYLNSIVEVYGSLSTDFVFVKYGHIAGYVNKHALVTPEGKEMTVKSSTDLVVRAVASSSSESIGTLKRGTKVSMLTSFKGWAFVTSDELSGYVLASGLKTYVSKAETQKPVKSRNEKKRVALTFDDGPHPKVTAQILNILEKYNAKATFFVIGQEVEKHPEILKSVYEAGHEIGNHTYNHEKLTTISLKDAKLQIQSTDSVIKSTIGKNATVFRPPYGAYDKTIVNQIKVPIVMWTIDTLDWKHRDPEKTVLAINEQVQNGSIILMHDIHQSTADALEMILSTLQKQGYEFVTASELLKK